MKVFVFDLDDTLYDESTFVRSGFMAVANYLWQEFGIHGEESFKLMWNSLEEHGRGLVFNETLRHYGLERQQTVRKCLSVYRLHSPDIHLLPDAESILQDLNDRSVYIVTDGHKIVQYNKLAALGLYTRVNRCFITYRYGRKHAKPSPYCFNKIAQIEKVNTSDIVYIGDNPNKDFVGIKPLGYRTIRIKRGPYANLLKSDEFNAEAEIDTLTDIINVIQYWGRSRRTQ
ncbi:HAD family hydrolase [Paenibacillus sp. MER TA 81-3]|uniref:HAD family hydrolase n=1 Tax=Paenibacillus sp. MER TA 81-3 TaxID=2939573 RepID=UPI00203DCA8C|nr:HAD family hydrolase [Paenibacillus sp. MER TA 81-3]MCM3338750.1 HAD family hydrolase [Paenibacillus sp. MER TA 81-3]